MCTYINESLITLANQPQSPGIKLKLMKALVSIITQFNWMREWQAKRLKKPNGGDAKEQALYKTSNENSKKCADAIRQNLQISFQKFRNILISQGLFEDFSSVIKY